MKTRLVAAISAGALAALAGLVALAQPPAETRDGNRSGYKPAFPNQTRAPALTTDTKFEIKAVTKAGDIQSPWAVEFLPGGKFLVTERLAGQFRIVDAAGKVSAPIKNGVPAVMSQGQGGLLDVALDPDFAKNQMIYWSYAEPAVDGGNNTAVAKGKLVDGATPKIENVQVIYHQRPTLKSNLHFGSRLVFARDGTLFVTQGERSILPGRMQAQDLKSGLGKIARINKDGTIPRDNPFVGDKNSALPEIWSYGHRNVQGAFLHPTTGELWELEHGPQGGDEINIARKGKDYGWPTITYGVEYGSAHTKIGEGAAKAGMEQPVYYWDPVIAPGGLAYYNAALFPKWKGSVFAAGLNSNYVARLTLSGDKVTGEERFNFSDQKDRFRDIGVGPDGAIYVLTDGPQARLLKIVPKP